MSSTPLEPVGSSRLRSLAPTQSPRDDIPLDDLFRQMATLWDDPVRARRLRDRIVERCLPVADDIARRFYGRGESHDDLVQVARVGLVKAVMRFDVEMGSDFGAFAVPTIVGEIRRHFRDNSWSVKVPRRLKELQPRLGRCTADLYQLLGRAPTASELAAELGLTREEVVEGLVANSGYRSLPLHGIGDGDTPGIVDTVGSIDARIDCVDDRETLRRLLGKLSERERNVVLLRFFESLSQTQIAQRVGVSQMQVSRLLAKALNQLREMHECPSLTALKSLPALKSA
jgi:RNA polymerase sigma-B factor